MSWDVHIFKVSQPYPSAEAIPAGEKLLALGTMAHVHAAVVEHFPGTDWSDASWGLFRSTFGSIEFNLGRDDPAQSMMLHVRASSEVVVPIVALCRDQKWSAFDCSTGELLEHADDPTAGIEGWLGYRERVIAGYDSGT